MKGRYLSIAFHTTVFTVLLSAFAYVGFVWYFGTLPGEGGKAAHLTWKSEIIDAPEEGEESANEWIELAFTNDGRPIALFNDSWSANLIFTEYIGNGNGNCFPGSNWDCEMIDWGDPPFAIKNNNGVPIILYQRSYGEASELVFGTYVGNGLGNCSSGNNWRCEIVDKLDEGTWFQEGVDMTVDTRGNPLVVYNTFRLGNGTEQIKFAEYRGNGGGNCFPGSNWDCETLGNDYAIEMALTLTDTVVPSLAYNGVHDAGQVGHFLKYLTLDGRGEGDCSIGRWSCETVVKSPNTLRGADIISLPSGEIKMSFYDQKYRGNDWYMDTEVASFVGAGGNCPGNARWRCDIVEKSGSMIVPTAMIIDNNGNLAVGYMGGAYGENIKYAEWIGAGEGNCFPGSNWDCEDIVEHIYNQLINYIDLKSDVNGYPSFVYTEGSSATVAYVTAAQSIPTKPVVPGQNGPEITQSQDTRRAPESSAPPQPVVGINFVVEGTTARLSWQDPPSFTLDHIEILRNYNPVPEAITGDAYTVIDKGQQMFTDSNLVLGNTYKYIVRSVNGYGSYVNSEEIAIEMKEEEEIEEEVKEEPVIEEEAVGGEEVAETPLPPVEEEPTGILAVASIYKAIGIPDVYYIASNEKRYVFPDEDVYKSWYRSFDAVKEVDVRELAFYPLAGIVTYRPGLQLIKITTEPKVYVLESGGVLRWIVNESIASELFGRTWSDRIVIVDAALFVHYRRGKDIASTTDYSIPEGVSEAGCGEGETALTGTCALVEKEGIPSEAPVVFAPTLEKEGIAPVSVTPTSSVFLWVTRLLAIVLFIVIFSIKALARRA